KMMKNSFHSYFCKPLGWLLTLNLLLVSQAFAQQTVTGIVKSQDDQESLPGVSVLVKGTQRGTVTDLDGAFALQASQGEVLVFSFVGYDSKEITIQGGSSDLEIFLEPT